MFNIPWTVLPQSAINALLPSEDNKLVAKEGSLGSHSRWKWHLGRTNVVLVFYLNSAVWVMQYDHIFV